MNKFNKRRSNATAERRAKGQAVKKKLGLKQKSELEKKLVSGKVRSGKGKKKVEKARRRAQRETVAAGTADTSMGNAPKATKGLGGAGQAQTQRAASAMETGA